MMSSTQTADLHVRDIVVILRGEGIGKMRKASRVKIVELFRWIVEHSVQRMQESGSMLIK